VGIRPRTPNTKPYKPKTTNTDKPPALTPAERQRLFRARKAQGMRRVRCYETHGKGIWISEVWYCRGTVDDDELGLKQNDADNPDKVDNAVRAFIRIQSEE